MSWQQWNSAFRDALQKLHLLLSLFPFLLEGTQRDGFEALLGTSKSSSEDEMKFFLK